MIDHTEDEYSQLRSFLGTQTNISKGQAWGKVMLFGEYAVLEGASALLTATSHQAKAHYLSFDHLDIVESFIPELSNLKRQIAIRKHRAKYLIIAFQLGNSLLITTDNNKYKNDNHTY